MSRLSQLSEALCTKRGSTAAVTQAAEFEPRPVTTCPITKN
jgi:hypothetical protein